MNNETYCLFQIISFEKYFYVSLGNKFYCFCGDPLVVEAHGHSGVATGWTGVDMSTSLLLEVTPESDTNPTSFYRGRGRSASRPPL